MLSIDQEYSEAKIAEGWLKHVVDKQPELFVRTLVSRLCLWKRIAKACISGLNMWASNVARKLICVVHNFECWLGTQWVSQFETTDCCWPPASLKHVSLPKLCRRWYLLDCQHVYFDPWRLKPPERSWSLAEKIAEKRAKFQNPKLRR